MAHIMIRNLELDGVTAKLVSARTAAFDEEGSIAVYLTDGSEYEGSWIDGAYRPDGYSDLSDESIRIITAAIAAKL